MSLTLKDTVIDFSNQQEERVTIKARLDGPLTTTNESDFWVRVIITDRRTNAVHDSGEQPPTVVR